MVFPTPFWNHFKGQSLYNRLECYAWRMRTVVIWIKMLRLGSNYLLFSNVVDLTQPTFMYNQHWKHQNNCEICSKLTIKVPERRQYPRSCVFIANYEQISHLFSGISIVNFELVIQPAITYSKITIETLEQGVEYVQS